MSLGPFAQPMRPSPLAMLHVSSPLLHTQFQLVSIPPPLIVAVEPSTRTLVSGGSFIDLNFNFRSKAPRGDEAKRAKAMSPILAFVQMAITNPLQQQHPAQVPVLYS